MEWVRWDAAENSAESKVQVCAKSGTMVNVCGKTFARMPWCLGDLLLKKDASARCLYEETTCRSQGFSRCFPSVIAKEYREFFLSCLWAA